jgi:aspartate aminotransferase
MNISKQIAEAMTRSSWIRKMFEEGNRLKQDGKGPVYDLSLGNPDLEPPASFDQELRRCVEDSTAGLHKYMPNVGYPQVRQAIAEYLQEEMGLPFTAEHLIMCVGAAGGLNAVLKALLDPGDEVIVFSPYFVEYLFYVPNHRGKTVIVPTNSQFQFDLRALRQALGERTKAVLINTPNNPTGVVYAEESLEQLAEELRQHSLQLGRPVYLVADEPYRRILYDARRPPEPIQAYEETIFVTSHSKDLGLPGERIGYIAISPRCRGAKELFDAIAFTTRTLGFVNAPALMQRVVAGLQRSMVDLNWYRRKRDLLYESLTRYGYQVVRPGGAFYLYPATPIQDDVAFVQKLQQHRVLTVPGSGFGTPGYFRICYCVDDEIIEGSLPAFKQVMEECQS